MKIYSIFKREQVLSHPLTALVFSLAFALVLFASSCDTVSTDTEDTTDAPVLEKDIDMTDPSEDGVPDSVSEAYREDAVVMALHRVREKDSTRILIPEDLIDFYFSGLIHVYNFDHEARDTVVKHYPVHNPPSKYLAHRITVAVDTSHAWTNAWLDGNVQTGNESVDQLVAEYELSLGNVYVNDGQMVADLKAGPPVNPDALARKFEEEVPEIAYSESAGLGGDGPSITAQVQEDKVIYTYSYGWGDCYSGCIYRRSWEFAVYPDGNVEFIRSYGNAL